VNDEVNYFQMNDSQLTIEEQRILNNIRRSQALRSAPVGVDMGAVVATAVAAYWKGREEELDQLSAQKATLVYQEETSRAIELTLAKTHNLLPEFFVEIAAILIGTIAAILGAYFVVLGRGAAFLNYRWVICVPGTLGILLTVYLILKYRYNQVNWTKSQSKFRWALRHSMGTLTGVLFLVSMIGIWEYYKTRAAVETFARDQLLSLSLISMETKQSSGKFLVWNEERQSWLVLTEDITPQKAVYSATATDYSRGTYIAKIGSDSGTLEYQATSSAQPSLQYKLLLGTVEHVDDEGFIIKFKNSGEFSPRITFDRKQLVPKIGEAVSVVVDSSNNRAIRIADSPATIQAARSGFIRTTQ
jgi:hypothetical protein